MIGLWLALAVSLGSDPPEASEGSEVQLVAERVLHDGKKLISTAEGKAKLTTADAAVDADRIVYDQNRRMATAMGHVVARLTQGGKIAVIADLMTLRFDEQQQLTDVYLFDGRAISKKDVLIEKFLAADTEEKVEQAGTTQALLTGNHLQRHGNDWTIEELELVPCECDFKNPSWSITSSSATIDTDDDRVSITNPVIRIKGIPVLWLPWLSLPLTERQTGLLFPKPDYSPLNGFSFEQPVFVTLGRSADVTLTPGFFTGAPIFETETVDPTDPMKKVKTKSQNTTGIAGPRLRNEFRYVPSNRASGRINLGLVYDFRTRRDVANAALRDPLAIARGWRGELSWLHTQDFDRGFGARVEFSGHSDGDYNRDNTIDVILLTATYLRSSATAFHRGTHHSLTLDVGLRQDIQWGYDWLGTGYLAPNASRVIGNFGPGTLQRLPALTFGWSPGPIGPVRFTFDAEAVRLAPMFSSTGDEGSAAVEGAILPTPFRAAVDRLFTASPTGLVTSGMGNRQWEAGEREARDRLMLRPTIAAAVSPGGAFTLSGAASWRQLLWAGEASGRSWARGYLVLGGALETQLSRRFGEGAVRHVIEPRVEVRAVPFGADCGWGTSGVGGCGAARASRIVPYDQVDFAVPDVTPRVQAIAELRQRFHSRDGTEVLRLEVGQGGEFSIAPGAPAATAGPLVPTLGETFGRATFRIGWLSGQGALRIDPLASRLAGDGLTPISTGLTRASARLDLDDGLGHGAYGTYENLVMEGTSRSRQPLDLLFLIDRGYTSATRMQQITFGVRWNFGPFAMRYDALIAEQSLRFNSATTTTPTLAFSQHSVGVGITPACDCWRLDLTATQIIPWAIDTTTNVSTARLLAPSVGFSVSVARFGTIGGR